MRREGKVGKAWNGGSPERAMEAARERRKVMVAQGASYCPTCSGEGATGPAELCPICRGAGVILPPGGLQLPTTH